jgi:alanyl-tRNA synthetase
MPLKIVDTGYGLERLVWITQGSPTIYDAIFPQAIHMLVEELDIQRDNDLLGAMSRLASRNPPGDFYTHLTRHFQDHHTALTTAQLHMLHSMEFIYALSDHARCLVFLLGDGIVPSNMGAGYLARLVIRRGLRLLSQLKSSFSLDELVLYHLKDLTVDFPQLTDTQDRIQDILKIETGKYQDTLERGKRLIQRYIEENKTFTPTDLVTLYDTHGLSPPIVQEFAGKHAKITIPADFDSMIAEKHGHITPTETKQTHPVDIPPLKTRDLFYDQPDECEFDATIQWKKKIDDAIHVILDQTLFYPEGGGQPPDTGYLVDTQGKKHPVHHVYRTPESIVHVTTSDPPGTHIHGKIDWERRHRIMQHHTSTHIINAAARTILGDHIWQTGSQVGDTDARLDITHYKHITPTEQHKIEHIANTIIRQDNIVKREWMDRNTAEHQYGFHLYQGGAPRGNMLRVIEIPNTEVEACGGTHVSHTGDIGLIKIMGIEHLQDGVERIRFTAGKPALTYIQQQETILQEACGILGVEPSQLPRSVKRFFEEWKTYQKELQKTREMTVKDKSTVLLKEGEKIAGATIVCSLVDMDMKTLLSLAGHIINQKKSIVILGNKKGQVVMARSPTLSLDVVPLLRDAARLLGGSGGGKPDLAQGGGPHVHKITDALNQALTSLRKQLT